MNTTPMKLRTLMAAVICTTVLAACQSGPSAPEYKYYRLLPSTAGGTAKAVQVPAEIGVRPLRADGLYTERAIIFSDEQQRRLQQYHYHYWVYPPGQLIQEHLAEFLSLGRSRPVMKLAEFSVEPQYVISGRVVRFEKILTGDAARASVVLELTMEKNGHMLWQQSYSADEVVPGKGMTVFSGAVEAALNDIYGRFADDIGRLKLEHAAMQTSK